MNACFTDFLQYSIAHTGVAIHGDKLRELPEPIACRDEIIPNPDSTPLSILNHPLGTKHEIDFAAYDPTELSLSPEGGDDPVLVLYFDLLFTMLIGK